MMHRNRSVDTHAFSMVPRADIPRASFKVQKTHKTTFDAGYLIPVYSEEVLPGDTFKVRMTAFARLATPIFPVMDNLYLESFFFFVPNRIVWSNWRKFMGEQRVPSDSISYIVPTVTSAAGGFPVNSIYDYFGLPTVGQVDPAGTVTVNSLPLRGYNVIYNDWFKDENLSNGFTLGAGAGDGPDTVDLFALIRRAKRHDYFTSCLPWPQKGGTSVSVPLGTTAPVLSSGTMPTFKNTSGSGATQGLHADSTGFLQAASGGTSALPESDLMFVNTGLYADLSTATAATINQLRQSFQIQKLLERDARGGTRYTELVRSHFGVTSPDARLQRPEYLGGGSTPVSITPIAQTSGTGTTGTSTPLGNLASVGTMLARGHGFSQSFTEHGYILGLVMVRADLTYQQGLRKMWSRSTRFDFYFPAFAMLGEQAVLKKEIYCTGLPGNDDLVFGYQERWAEYRHSPSMITGLFRSTTAGTLDAWHLAQHFTTAPSLNSTFIAETPPLSRILAVGASANGAQFIFDSFFDCTVARPMPLYSVPGLIDHF